MRTALIILPFLLGNCRSAREPVQLWEQMVVETIRVEMVSTEETSNALYTLWGTATEPGGDLTVPFVKIKLTREDGRIEGTYSDEEGDFSIDIPPGIYLLEVSWAGFETYSSELTAIEGMKEEIKIIVGD